jgi:hypothetical protein
MTVDERTYSYDLWISLDGRVKAWQRREGHFLNPEDLEEALEENPEIVVVGTGASGIMEVGERVGDFLASKGIKLIARPTQEAVREYNQLRDQDQKVVGLFHLTC